MYHFSEKRELAKTMLGLLAFLKKNQNDGISQLIFKMKIMQLGGTRKK